MNADVVIVGGGPTGLATGIEAARRGLEVIVVERCPGAPDKACGEGLMPAGVLALERLGALKLLDRSQAAPFDGVRYVQEDGQVVEGRFPAATGLGIRRTALATALHCAARQSGVNVVTGTARNVSLEKDGVALEVDGRPLFARVIVAADGLHSPLRRSAGLEAPARGTGRRGLRRHYAGVEAGRLVEVHWSPGVECYVTPVGERRLGVAFLFDERGLPHTSFDALLARFPAVAARLRGAAPDSEVRGAGPLLRRVRGVVAGRLVLAGDAAGYVDAITGEGLSLGFACAEALGHVLPSAVRGDEGALGDYAAAHRRIFRPYALRASALVALSRRPALRRRVLAALSRSPLLFEALMRRITGGD